MFEFEFTQVLDSKKHDRKKFDCGENSLNKYLKEQASQDFKNKVSVCFVVVENESKVVLGYYTLSNNSISRSELDQELQKKVKTKYQQLPTTLIGRLAVDKRQKGQNLGRDLLMDGLIKALAYSKQLGSVAVVVDPINNSESFYEKFGFMKLESGKMFLPMKTIEELIEKDI